MIGYVGLKLKKELFAVDSSYPWRYFKEAVHLE